MKYDPIMCMMVDDSVKTEDAKSYGKYKLPNGEIVEVIDRKNVHGADTIVYKNSRGVHFATADWFMSNVKKVRDSVKAKDSKTIEHAIRSCDEVGCKTRDKSMSEMKIDELRDLAVSLGADKNKLYGTSKQALIIIIDNLKKKI